MLARFNYIATLGLLQHLMMLSGDEGTVINGGLYLLYLWDVRGVV